MSNKPRYRDDIKGDVRTFVQECEATMRNEFRSALDFVLSAEDTGAWSEYRDYLTENEMRSAFKRAVQS